ncbi:MAG: ATP-binding protein [Pirellulales bacterium]
MSIALDVPVTQDLELATLRTLNYDWSVLLRGVWSDPRFNAPEIHPEWRQEFQEELLQLKADGTNNSPPGWMIVGPGGSGKTHFLSTCRQQAVAQRYGFVLVDMTDVRSFWGTVLQGYIDSLQQEYADGKFQQQILIEKFLATLPMNVPVETAMKKIREYPVETLAAQVGKVVEIIRRQHPQETLQHHDIIRELLAMTSHDSSIAAAGLNWLNAGQVDEEIRRQLGFTKSQEEPRRIVKALSWMMSLCGPTVVAFDQLDPIVQQLDPAARSAQDLDSQGQAALAIISEIAHGLRSMREYTYDTLTVVACLDVTLETLRKYTISTWQAGFQEPHVLKTLTSSEAARATSVSARRGRLRKTGMMPPSPTWPIAASALVEIAGQTPRELLQLCDAHP